MDAENNTPLNETQLARAIVRLRRDVRKLRTEVQNVRGEVAGLRAKSRLWGAVSGALTAVGMYFLPR